MTRSAVSFTQRLAQGRLLLDGAMGTSLMEAGLDRVMGAGGCTSAWNMDHPEVVQSIHASFIEAGSEVIQTNTFDASPTSLAVHGLEERMGEINRAGAAAARRAGDAADRPVLVAGNLGPCGIFLPPVGTATAGQIEASFAAQAEALSAGGVDSLCIETMLDLAEALCALRGIRRVSDLPVTVCLTFESRPRGFFTAMGNRPADSMIALAEAGAVAVGANCSVGSEALLELLPALLEASPVPVVLKPNAGLPEMEGDRAVYRQAPEDFARDLAAAVELGASAVGGCCGTDPRFLAALRGALDVSASGGAPG
jgi:5-methyltetrahydrofolate--homocysteine methyltransferase